MKKLNLKKYVAIALAVLSTNSSLSVFAGNDRKGKQAPGRKANALANASRSQSIDASKAMETFKKNFNKQLCAESLKNAFNQKIESDFDRLPYTDVVSVFDKIKRSIKGTSKSQTDDFERAKQELKMLLNSKRIVSKIINTISKILSDLAKDTNNPQLDEFIKEVQDYTICVCELVKRKNEERFAHIGQVFQKTSEPLVPTANAPATALCSQINGASEAIGIFKKNFLRQVRCTYSEDVRERIRNMGDLGLLHIDVINKFGLIKLLIKNTDQTDKIKGAVKELGVLLANDKKVPTLIADIISKVLSDLAKDTKNPQLDKFINTVQTNTIYVCELAKTTHAEWAKLQKTSEPPVPTANVSAIASCSQNYDISETCRVFERSFIDQLRCIYSTDDFERIRNIDIRTIDFTQPLYPEIADVFWKILSLTDVKIEDPTSRDNYVKRLEDILAIKGVHANIIKKISEALLSARFHEFLKTVYNGTIYVCELVKAKKSVEYARICEEHDKIYEEWARAYEEWAKRPENEQILSSTANALATALHNQSYDALKVFNIFETTFHKQLHDLILEYGIELSFGWKSASDIYHCPAVKGIFNQIKSLIKNTSENQPVNIDKFVKGLKHILINEGVPLEIVNTISEALFGLVKDTKNPQLDTFINTVQNYTIYVFELARAKNADDAKRRAEYDKAHAKWTKANEEWAKANEKWNQANEEWDQAYVKSEQVCKKWNHALSEWASAHWEWDQANEEWTKFQKTIKSLVPTANSPRSQSYGALETFYIFRKNFDQQLRDLFLENGSTWIINDVKNLPYYDVIGAFDQIKSLINSTSKNQPVNIYNVVRRLNDILISKGVPQKIINTILEALSALVKDTKNPHLDTFIENVQDCTMYVCESLKLTIIKKIEILKCVKLRIENAKERMDKLEQEAQSPKFIALCHPVQAQRDENYKKYYEVKAQHDEVYEYYNKAKAEYNKVFEELNKFPKQLVDNIILKDLRIPLDYFSSFYQYLRTNPKKPLDHIVKKS